MSGRRITSAQEESRSEICEQLGDGYYCREYMNAD